MRLVQHLAPRVDERDRPPAGRDGLPAERPVARGRVGLDVQRGRPAVYLYVQVIRPERIERLFYSVSLSLLQNVVLERDPNVKTNTDTWLVRMLGMSSGIEAIRSDIRSLLDQFIEDYRKVNQK